MRTIFIKSVIVIFLSLGALQETVAEIPVMPRIGGIAKVTYLISDYNLAKSYYGDFLGFDFAFAYDSPQGKVVSYKVNDRQFLEFIEAILR